MNTTTHIQAQVKVNLDQFIENVKQKTGDNLKSIVLYGGYAKNDYTYGKSHVNILLVFDHVDLDVLDSISLIIQKGMSEFKLSTFILTQNEIEPSSDVFAVKLFDIQKHHVILYGNNPVQNLSFDNKILKFIIEQEIRNLLTRMKFFYIQNVNIPEALLRKLQSGITGMLVSANTLLYLKHGTYYQTRPEVIEQLMKESQMDKSSLQKLLEFKNHKVELNAASIREGYDLLMIQLKQLTKLVSSNK